MAYRMIGNNNRSAPICSAQIMFELFTHSHKEDKKKNNL